MSKLKSEMKSVALAMSLVVRTLLAVLIAMIAVVYFISMREVGAVILIFSSLAILPKTGGWMGRVFRVSQPIVLGAASILLFVGMSFVALMDPSPERVAEHEAKIISEKEAKEVADEKASEEKSIRADERAKEKRVSNAKAAAKKAETDARRAKDYVGIRGEKTVRSALADGDSAKFRNTFVSNKNAYCGEVNGKNLFGAYVGFTRFIVVGPSAMTEDSSNTKEFSTLWETACSR